MGAATTCEGPRGARRRRQRRRFRTCRRKAARCASSTRVSTERVERLGLTGNARTRWTVWLLLAFVVCATPRPAAGYSVLAHEANIDALWETTSARCSRAAFREPPVTTVHEARAPTPTAAAVIQDLGYYPFGSHFFSNLVHYMRTGDFVEALIRDAHDVNEYAFALGALGALRGRQRRPSDGGQPGGRADVSQARAPSTATRSPTPNRRQRTCSSSSPSTSCRWRRRLRAGRVPDVHRLRGGEAGARARVPRDVWPRDEGRVLAEDLAIGTYRCAVSKTIPEMTVIAWRDKERGDPEAHPGAPRRSLRLNLSRQEYDKAYGTEGTRNPGLLARFLAFRLQAAAEDRAAPAAAVQSADQRGRGALPGELSRAPRERYRSALDALGRGRLDLPNTDFDTGKPTAQGEYTLADDTYAELLKRLTARRLGHCSGRAPPKHQRVLRRRAEPEVEPQGAEARGEGQGNACSTEQGHKGQRRARRNPGRSVDATRPSRSLSRRVGSLLCVL